MQNEPVIIRMDSRKDGSTVIVNKNKTLQSVKTEGKTISINTKFHVSDKELNDKIISYCKD